jgi:hypothetical protein
MPIMSASRNQVTLAGTTQVDSSTMTISFPAKFSSPPVLAVTVEVQPKETSPLKASLLNIQEDKAVVLVESSDRALNLHWVAVGELS